MEPNSLKKGNLSQTLNSAKELLEEDANSPAVQSARELIKSLVKALKNFKIYLPNNPVHQKSLKDFYSKLSGHLEEFGDADLNITQYTISYQGQSVYENINRLESIAFRLFVDGIRQMTFLSGFTEEESSDLLEILGKNLDSQNPDDDLVTLLWQKNFQHLRPQIIQDFFEDGTEAAGEQKPGFALASGVSEMIASEVKKESVEAAKASSGLSIEQTQAAQYAEVFRLTEEEIARIKEEIKFESEKDLITEMINIIYSVLQVEKDEGFFSDLINLIVENTMLLLDSGDMIQAEKVIQLFAILKQQTPPLSSGHMAILEKAIQAFGRPENLGKMEKHLNELDDRHLKAFYVFLSMLDSSAAFTIIDLLEKAKIRKTRKVLVDVLVESGKKDILPILNRLQGSPWFVIRNLIQVIGKIGNDAAVDSLKKLVSYPDERVRKELLTTLNLIWSENPKVREMAIPFLNDREIGIRKQALQMIQHHKETKALPVLKRIIEDKGFALKEMEEKLLVYQALGKLGDSSLIPRCKEMLKSSFFFWIKKTMKEEAALCAVMALKHEGSAEAVLLLTESRKHNYKTVADASARALNEIQRMKDRKEAPPEIKDESDRLESNG